MENMLLTGYLRKNINDLAFWLCFGKYNDLPGFSEYLLIVLHFDWLSYFFVLVL